MTNRNTIQKLFIFCYISQFLSNKKGNKKIEVEHFEKSLTLLETIEDDQNININIHQRKPWPLNGVDAACQENTDNYR